MDDTEMLELIPFLGELSKEKDVYNMLRHFATT